MKKPFLALTLSTALMAGVVGTAVAQAQSAAAPAGTVKIALFNMQRAVIESNEGRTAAEKLQKQFAPKQNDLQAKQAEIEKLQKQLREQEKTLSDEARNNLVRQIESKTKEFNRSTEDATNDAQQAEAQTFNEIGQRIYKVLDDYARKNGYQVVFDVSSPQSPVLWASASMDLTDDIVKLYNAAPPAAAPAAAPAAPAAKPAAKPAAPAVRPAAPAAKPSTTTPAGKKPAQP